MNEYVLLMLFSEDLESVAIRFVEELGKWSFVGEERENKDLWYEHTGYRALEKAVGASKDAVELQLVRKERTSLWNGENWVVYVMYGVLSREMEEVKGLLWLRLNDNGIKRLLSNEYVGNGCLYTYYLEACKMMDVEPRRVM